MNIQKEIERYLFKINSCNDQELCDLCISLISLNQVKKAVENVSVERLDSAIRYTQKIKRHDLTVLLQLLKTLTILRNS